MEDLIHACGYPFKHLLMFAVAAAIVAVVDIFREWVANLIMLGYMSFVIRRVSDGRLDEGFLIDIDDIKSVGGLGLAIWIIIFAPAIIVRSAGLDEALGMSFAPAILIPWPLSFGVLGILAIIWAIFYYPMALLVAGFTQSFTAVINPLVGIDTIKRMGAVYVKVWLMYFGIQIGTIILMVVANMSGVVLPIVGSLVLKPIEFFANMMIACLLGLAIFKCADRLGVHV